MITDHPFRRLGVVLASVLFFALSVPLAPAQQPGKEYALIYGTVWGPDNRPVAGVPIKIRPAERKKPVWNQVSDHSGEFAQRVPAGKAEYLVWANIKHAKGEQPPQTTVQITYDERVDISLRLTAAQMPRK
ncbi:MAG TPA: hypothetical protein VFU76_02890 [Terriglobales bacterium]|nr:hypothetical protein [Terriglobales bacterium]